MLRPFLVNMLRHVAEHLTPAFQSTSTTNGDLRFKWGTQENPPHKVRGRTLLGPSALRGAAPPTATLPEIETVKAHQSKAKVSHSIEHKNFTNTQRGASESLSPI